MASGSNNISFGLQAQQQDVSYDDVRNHVQLLERLGYDSAWVIDHFIGGGGVPEADVLECWTLLAALARDTSTIKLGPLVACHSYRNPALTAKMAATVDVLSNGRLIFGYGYGWYYQEYEQYGYPYPSNKVRSEEFGEALEICTRMWADGRASFSGKYFTIEDAYCVPKPIQNPLPIMIGGRGPKFTMPWIAKYATMWNSTGTLADFATGVENLKRACDDIGRDIGEIELTWTGPIVMDSDADRLKRRVERRGISMDPPGQDQAAVVGTPDLVVERLQPFLDAGANGFIMHFGRLQNTASSEMFAADVMPHVGSA